MSIKKILILQVLILQVAVNFGLDINLRNLTLEQKIAQLFLVTAVIDRYEHQKHFLKKWYLADCEQVKSLIKDYQVGGVIFLGKSTCEKQFNFTKELQQASLVPLLIAQDLEWGLAMRLSDGMQFPRNQKLGLLSPDYDHLIYQMGYEIGCQCQVLGVHLNLAPVVDVNNNSNNLVIGSRSFGDKPELVAHKSILFMQGLQDAGVAACAKHFPGHGDTDVDSHYGLPCLQHIRKRLQEVELYSFQQMIQAGVKTIMIGHLEVPTLEVQKGLPASLSKNITTSLLKDEMGFAGLVLTDALDMAGVAHCGEPGQIALQALIAGADLLLCCPDVPQAIEAIKQAVLSGQISETELDLKVSKVLALKQWAGCGNLFKSEFSLELLHSPQACGLQRELFELTSINQ